MSEWHRSVLKLPMADLGNDERIPALLAMLNIQQTAKSDLDDDDGLFVGYGYLHNTFPYFSQSLYNRDFQERELHTIVLENRYLRAEFLPELGGRLWSLFDKTANRDLLLTNNTLAFGNLAICNAWFCGGVEWNMGIIGHSPFTCRPVHTALLHTKDGTPVLRIYEFERIRRCTYHIDFWLPDKSPRLYAGVSIHNPNETVVPMYWWSNIAVPEDRHARVIAPADAAYTNENETVVKQRQLQFNGTDITYPVQIPIPKDYFWKTRDARHKFICHVDKTGYGLCQASTDRQQGRKLFVWGQSSGAKRWQSLLETGGPTGHYVELQAGLGQTQYECIPMPPKTTWRWVESYGAIQLDPAVAHGPYAAAAEAAEAQVAGYDLAQVLENATHMKQKAETVLQAGSLWGGLENQKRRTLGKPPVNELLDFPEKDTFWTSLLVNGTVGEHDPTTPPESWMLDDDFTDLLRNAVNHRDAENWFAWLQLGAAYLAAENHKQAEQALLRSLALCRTVCALYSLAMLYWDTDRVSESLDCAAEALRLCPHCVKLARNLLILFIVAEQYSTALATVRALPAAVRNDGRVMLYTAKALLETGNTTETESLIHAHADTMITTVREGEPFATDLYKLLLEKKGLPQTDLPWEWNFGL